MNMQRNGGKGRNGSKVILVGEQHINHALRNTLIKHFDKHTTLQGVTFFLEGYSASISKDPKVREDMRSILKIALQGTIGYQGKLAQCKRKGLQIQCLDQLESKIQKLHNSGIRVSTSLMMALEFAMILKQGDHPDTECFDSEFMKGFIEAKLESMSLIIQYLESKTNDTNSNPDALHKMAELVRKEGKTFNSKKGDNDNTLDKMTDAQVAQLFMIAVRKEMNLLDEVTDSQVLKQLYIEKRAIEYIPLGYELPKLLSDLQTAEPILLQERDKTAADNIIEEYLQNKSDLIVALCGKGHLPGIEELLERNDISYAECTDTNQLKSALNNDKQLKSDQNHSLDMQRLIEMGVVSCHLNSESQSTNTDSLIKFNATCDTWTFIPERERGAIKDHVARMYESRKTQGSQRGM